MRPCGRSFIKFICISGASVVCVYMSIHSYILSCPLPPTHAVANQMVSEFGLVRVTVGEALRYHLAQFPESHLTEQIKSYLLVGETVPDELCVAALERRMLEAECNTRG